MLFFLAVCKAKNNCWERLGDDWMMSICFNRETLFQRGCRMHLLLQMLDPSDRFRTISWTVSISLWGHRFLQVCSLLVSLDEKIGRIAAAQE